MARLTGDMNMPRVTFHFHGRLLHYLPATQQTSSLSHESKRATAVKHAIEALGVPHTEVECILANERPVGFSYTMQEEDELDVYPAVPPEVSTPVHLRPPVPEPVRFVADNHLGRLVRYLRLLGFDVLHPIHLDDEGLAELSSHLGRVLLSRDRGLLKRKIVVHGFCLQTRDPHQQLLDVLARFNLHQLIEPWRRCLRCNGLLCRVAKGAIVERLEPKTKKYYHEFHMCQDCGRIYWKGSHYHPLRDLVDEVLAQSAGQSGR